MKILQHLLLIFVSAISSAGHCAIPWNPYSPKAFEGVNCRGEVDISERLPSLYVDNENQIDLGISFNSARRTASKTFGYGWWFGLTDSYAVKETQDSYKFVMPDASQVILKRNYKSKNLFETKNKRWVLAETATAITITGSCGMEFTFRRNSLTQLKYPNGATLYFRYEGDKLSQISAKGTPVICLRYEADAVYVDFPAQKRSERFKLSDVPGYGNMLSERTDFSAAKQIKKYSYKFSSNGMNEMSVEERGEMKKYRWEASNGIIAREESYEKSGAPAGSYEYEIPDKDEKDAYKYIARKSDTTKRLDVFYMNDRGVTVTRKDGGPTVKIYDNMSANCYGKPRRIETVYPDGKRDERLFLYDDKGRIVREIKNGKILYEIKRNDRKRNIAYYDGEGNPVWRKVFDERERVVSYDRGDGTKVAFRYLKGGNIEATIKKDGKTTTKIFNESMNIIKCLNSKN